MNEEELKKKIEDYFAKEYGNKCYFLDFIQKESLEENIETLLTRDKNFMDRINDLQKFEKMYQDDQRRAYIDALEEARVMEKEEMTKNEAFEILRGMTFESIVEYFRAEN